MKKLVTILALAATLSACASLRPERSAGVSASLVDFLYPKGEAPEAVTDTKPHLRVPLTVGLAFVPANGSGCGRCSGPSAALQSELLERVKGRFTGRNYVREITVIPEAYLRQGQGGFTTLEQLSRLYGFDVIALVSYDQVALGNDRTSSLLYWTLVGAYVIKGSHNEVHTFVDTAVVDVKSRKLLLRAPGIDVRGFNATMLENGREVAVQSDEAMRAATDQMIANLDAELATFRERIKADNSVIVTRRPPAEGGVGGGGALGGMALVALLAGLGLRRARRG
jgi:rhombotail lipoprotein